MTLPPFLPNLADPAVRVERLKLLAGGLQLLAISILIASNISPFFNVALTPSLGRHLGGGIAVALFEIAAMHIIEYTKP